jgi:hypothetical protein
MHPATEFRAMHIDVAFEGRAFFGWRPPTGQSRSQHIDLQSAIIAQKLLLPFTRRTKLCDSSRCRSGSAKNQTYHSAPVVTP